MSKDPDYNKALMADARNLENKKAGVELENGETMYVKKRGRIVRSDDPGVNLSSIKYNEKIYLVGHADKGMTLSGYTPKKLAELLMGLKLNLHSRDGSTLQLIACNTGSYNPSSGPFAYQLFKALIDRMQPLALHNMPEMHPTIYAPKCLICVDQSGDYRKVLNGAKFREMREAIENPFEFDGWVVKHSPLMTPQDWFYAGI